MSESTRDRADQPNSSPGVPAQNTQWAGLPVSGKSPANRKLQIAVLVAGGVLLLLGAVWINFGDSQRARQPLTFHTVTRSDLPITIIELGNLESQVETVIRCELDDVQGDGRDGALILYIIPNGSEVKKGDLLVEFDSAPLRELRLDRQTLEVLKARAEQIQATAKFENQKTQNETLLDEAKLKVELSKLDLQMFEDGDDGTYQISRKEIALNIQEKKNQIAEAQAGLAMETTNRNGIEMLHKLGYRGKGDLDQALYKYLQAEDKLVTATNALAKAKSDLRKLETYEHKMQLKQLGGALATAERSLHQVQDDNQALLVQAEAAKIASDRAFAKVVEMLQRYQDELEKCRIYAPHDGIVVYASGDRRDEIREGAIVEERHRILALPLLSSMQVRAEVHESVIDQIREGLRATIKVDAIPDHLYQGVVDSVDVLPDRGSWYSSDVRVYKTIIKIDGEVEGLKPGMSAVVEIHVDQLKDVLCVPLQAIVEIAGKNWCYVDSPSGIQPRSLSLGRTNDQCAQVLEGLKEGDRVVLNPAAVDHESREQERTISPEASTPQIP